MHCDQIIANAHSLLATYQTLNFILQQQPTLPHQPPPTKPKVQFITHKKIKDSPFDSDPLLKIVSNPQFPQLLQDQPPTSHLDRFIQETSTTQPQQPATFYDPCCVLYDKNKNAPKWTLATSREKNSPTFESPDSLEQMSSIQNEPTVVFINLDEMLEEDRLSEKTQKKKYREREAQNEGYLEYKPTFQQVRGFISETVKKQEEVRKGKDDFNWMIEQNLPSIRQVKVHSILQHYVG